MGMPLVLATNFDKFSHQCLRRGSSLKRGGPTKLSIFCGDRSISHMRAEVAAKFIATG